MTPPRKNPWRFLIRATAGLLFLTLAAAVWWLMPVLPRGTLPKDSEILDLSSDGRVLATRQEGRVTFWDMATLRVSGEIPENLTRFRKFTLSPDGRWLTATNEGLLKLWKVPAGRERDAVRNQRAWGFSAEPRFSPDGKWLAYGTEGPWTGDIKIWDLQQGREHTLLTKTRTSSLLFSPDGKTLLFKRDESKPGGPFVGRFCLWDTVTGLQKPLIEDIPVSYHDLVFSPDGRTLATDGGELDRHLVKQWDVATGDLRGSWKLAWPVSRLWFTADGTRLLVETHSPKWDDDSPLAKLAVIDPASPRPEKEGPIPFPSNISPDRRFLVCIQESPIYDMEMIYPDFPPTVLELPDLRERTRLSPLPNGKRLFLREIAPDGKLLALEEKWTDPADEPPPNPILDSLREWVGLKKRFYSPFGPFEGKLHFYETDTGQRQGAVPVVIGRHSVRWTPTRRLSWFTPDGRAVVVLGPEYTPTIWDLPLGKPWGRILIGWAVLAACFAGAGLFLRRGKEKVPSPNLPLGPEPP